MDNIESIYGTSAGAIVGILICLKFDWETINDYIIKRPWQDVFPIKVQNILDAYAKKGVYDVKTIEKCFKPLFDAKDISLDINLIDFYNLTNIELHMFSFEVNE
jgi:predicted acylesterase/phospholipase RssA